MEILGIRWVGINAENGHKLLLSVGFVVVILVVSMVLRAVVGLFLRRADHASMQAGFWTRQALSVLTAIVIIVGLLSIWFDDPGRLSTAFGLMSAGLAFALQQVITSLAGYLVILRGRTFTVGDRITMGGVRGDVLRLGFIQTTIMEMGEPPSVQAADPAVWVRSRQFTGRLVTVSNSRIFSEPVFNYTRDFPYIWEEMSLPIGYQADRAGAEQILLGAARNHAVDPHGIDAGARKRLQERFSIGVEDMVPRVFFRMTDNWLELTVRFVTPAHGVRDIKDAMSREIVVALDEAGIGIASATYDIVGFPPIRLIQEKSE